MDIVVKKSFKLCREFVCSFPRTAKQNTKTGWPQSPGICCLSVELDVWDRVSAESSPSEVSRETFCLCLPSCCLLLFSHSVMSDSLRPHGLSPTRLLCPWHFPGKSTGVSCHFLLQGIFPTQGSNPCLLHCRRILHRWATRKAHLLVSHVPNIWGPLLWKRVAIHSSWVTVSSHCLHIVFPLVHVCFSVQIFSFEKFTGRVALGLTPLIPF